MLVLSRKRDESIEIGNQISVKILKIEPNTVRLGVTAPREVPIRRNEIAAKKAAENAGGPTDDEVHEQVLRACLYGGDGSWPRLPDVPLERMLAVHAAVAAEPPVYSATGREITLYCDPRLIALVYAHQEYGSLDAMAEELGLVKADSHS